MIRNVFEKTLDGVAIFIKRRNGETIKILVDEGTFLNEILPLDAKIYLTTSNSGLSYASLLIRLEHGVFEKKLLHRFITKAPEGKIVDHINRKTHDNRLANLRLVDDLESMQNRNLQANNTSGVRGVTRRSSGKYCARVRRDRKIVYYEQFDSLEEAEKAVISKRIELLPFSEEMRGDAVEFNSN